MLTLPDQRQWIDFTRNREFPLSGVLSVLLHLTVLVLFLFGLLRIFDRPASAAIEFEPVFVEPGAGNQGHSTELQRGSPTGTDVTGSIDTPPILPYTKPDQPDAEVTPLDTRPRLPDDPDGTPIRPSNPASMPKLTSLLKGLPSGNSNKGDGGPGKGTGGIGDGTRGNGRGPDRPENPKIQRMLRWTIFFNTDGAADYIRQMKALGVILGVQTQDESIFIIKDIARRPALAERGAKIEDRIFWMDDNPQSVRAMTEELQLQMQPSRIIAFFPESIEKKLLECELLYGKRFGRTREDMIKETKFRVEFALGQPQFKVVEQH
jgi:hypothetical protein